MKEVLLILTMFISQMSISQESTKMLETKFVGKYRTGRAPCEVLPDGSRRWARTTGFEITKLIDGNLKVTYVEINYDFNKNQSIQLDSGQEYFVTIKLTENRITELGLGQDNTIMTYRNPIKNEEIIKIKKKLE
jgi:hypothetical protein